MARCAITNVAKLRKIERAVGRPVLRAMTRGGTNHRIDVLAVDGSAWILFRNREDRSRFDVSVDGRGLWPSQGKT